MRNRHFSPQISCISPSLSLLSPSHARLKMVGSTSKLRTYNSTLLSQSDRKIGNYSYNPGQQIGSGYSSKVYKGQHIKDSSDCAIKVIQLKRYSQQSLRMLDNQIQILKTLDHPNVIKCYDIYKTQSHCYIITELCGNGDLMNYITRRGKLEETVCIEIMNEVINGVKYLLKKGILHRDLKPANILNDRKTWKIADFGFAIFSEKEIKTRYNVGTPLYMPLEALVKNVYSPLSDIFSIGVIFYELLTGITPWQCKNEKELIKKMNTLPYCLSERFKISQTTRQLLQRFCSLEPEQRLSKPQFMTLNIKSQPDQCDFELKTSSKLVLQKSHSQLGDQLMKSHSSINILSNKSILSDKIDTKQQTKNNHILISQLHYCRFVYYIIRNISYILVNQKTRNKLTLILYKHLQKVIKQLADNKNNWFNLKNWDGFKESKKYYSTHLTMKQYSVRYEKQYLTFLKKAELNIVRDINKDLNQLSAPEAISSQTYRKVLNAVAPIIREANHNTTFAITEVEAEQTLTSQLKASIEGISSLYKYYKLVELSLEEFQNYDTFERKSNIKVQIDYKNSQSATVEHLTQLRKNIKFI